MRRCDIYDIDMIENIMKDERVFDDICDDQISFREDIDMAEALNNDNVYILSTNDYCMIMFIRLNAVTFDCHICSLPEFKGKELVNAGKEALKWMSEHISCRKFVANIPSYNRKAVVFAKMCGFEREGINKNSFMKNDILYDQISLGKEVVSCQPHYHL